MLPLDGAALEDQYRASLEKLGVKPGMLGVNFKGAPGLNFSKKAAPFNPLLPA